MRRLVPLVALLVLPLSGCVTPGIHMETVVDNQTGQTLPVLAKAWDHNGKLVLNATVDVAPGITVLGRIEGDEPRYGSTYTWFAHALNMTHQEESGPDNQWTGWTITVTATAIRFDFGIQ